MKLFPVVGEFFAATPVCRRSLKGAVFRSEGTLCGAVSGETPKKKQKKNPKTIQQRCLEAEAAPRFPPPERPLEWEMTNLGSESSDSPSGGSSRLPTVRAPRPGAPPPANSQLTVAVRIRPLNETETQRRDIECARALDSTNVLLVDPEKFENNILRQNRQHERNFLFDAVFGPDSSHEEVHSATTAPLVDFVVGGSNATVFAYGPTGSGKTYTMVGTAEKPGLMTLITKSLYEKINPHEYTVFISFLEIYNEIIRDLLISRSPPLDLLEDEKGAVQVPGLSRVKAPNTSKIMRILQEGNARRSQEPTAANRNSSRSHALLQITLYKNSVQHGKLFLIDLAGSERAANTQNQGKRLKEGAAINRSLLALGNVINALSSGNKGRYVNYRDSKLTRLLKDSLGGNSKTIMLAHVTPSSSNYDESYNTLVYASRARNITTRIVFNRPRSADNAYSAAVRDIHRQAVARTAIPHALSSHQISEKGLKIGEHSDTAANRPIAENRRFTSLFNSLKSQYLSICEKQQKLRSNQEAFDVETNIASKAAILKAWEGRTKADEEKYSEVIERIKTDSNEEEKRLTLLHESRRKVEKAIRRNNDVLRTIEGRLRSQARDGDQTEVVNLLVRMAERDAERMALASDSALQNLRIQKQQNSLQKVQKYEQIADKLIHSELSDEERIRLRNEYRIIRTQMNYHLIPLKQKENVVSWNALILEENGGNRTRLRLPQIVDKPKLEKNEMPKPSTVSSLPTLST